MEMRCFILDLYSDGSVKWAEIADGSIKAKDRASSEKDIAFMNFCQETESEYMSGYYYGRYEALNGVLKYL